MTIDRRYKLQCACGCGQLGTMPNFRVMLVDGNKRFVLPFCWKTYAEELAALHHIRDLVRTRKTWMDRLPKAMLVYRLQRIVHGRTPDQGRRTAFRSALIFALPRKVGLLVSRVWTWQPAA